MKIFIYFIFTIFFLSNVFLKTQDSSKEKKRQLIELKEDNEGLLGIEWDDQVRASEIESRKVYEKIHKLIIEIEKEQSEIYKKYFAVDDELDILFQKISFWEGNIRRKIEFLQRKEEEEKKKAKNPAEKQDTLLSKIEEFKQELNKIKEEIESIDKEESLILDQLKKLDNKLSELSEEFVEARKLTKKMLNIKKESNAKANLDQLNKLLNKIEEGSRAVQKNFIKNISDSLNKIQTHMQDVKTKVEDFESKNVSLGLLEVKKEQTIIKKEEKKEIKKTWTYLFKVSVNIASEVIIISKNVKNWFIEIYQKGIAKGKELEKTSSNKKDTPDIKNQIEKLNEEIKELEKEREQFSQKRRDLIQIKNRRINVIREKLDFFLQIDTEKEIGKPLKIKDIMQSFYKKVSQTFYFILSRTKYFITFFYNEFIVEKWDIFVSEVETRVNDIEKREKILEHADKEEAF